MVLIHYDDVAWGRWTWRIKLPANRLFLTIYSGEHQRIHKASHYWPFVRGIHRKPVDSPHKGPVMRGKRFVSWRNHVLFATDSLHALGVSQFLPEKHDSFILISNYLHQRVIKQIYSEQLRISLVVFAIWSSQEFSLENHSGFHIDPQCFYVCEYQICPHFWWKYAEP